MSMGFPKQEYWSGLPFPSPGDLPDPGIEPMSAALACRFFTTKPSGKPSSPHYKTPIYSHPPSQEVWLSKKKKKKFTKHTKKSENTI